MLLVTAVQADSHATPVFASLDPLLLRCACAARPAAHLLEPPCLEQGLVNTMHGTAAAVLAMTPHAHAQCLWAPVLAVGDIIGALSASVPPIYTRHSNSVLKSLSVTPFFYHMGARSNLVVWAGKCPIAYLDFFADF